MSCCDGRCPPPGRAGRGGAPEIELEISGVGSDGAGLGRDAGLAVFVPGALPGERVRVRIRERKKNYARAELLAVLQPSPRRIAPACPVYGVCGGCAWQQVDYDYELELKRQIVAQTLRRVGGVEIAAPLPLPAQRPLYYRNRAILHAAAAEKGFALGFYIGKSRRLCPADDCLLLMPPLKRLQALLRKTLPDYAAAFIGLRALALRCNSSGSALLLTLIAERPLPADALHDFARELTLREPRLSSVWQNSGPPLYGEYGAGWRHIAGEERLSDSLGGLEFRLAPGSFTQVNPAQALRLYGMIARALRPQGGLLLDLYSGVGMIALYLAREAETVIGVEQYAPATADARENAALNKIGNCRFIAGAVERALPALVGEGIRPCAAVLDPPRAGCAPEAVQALLALAPKRIAYASCNPATLARDLRLLLADGSYRLDSVQPVDMFPRTAHVETVVLMSRVEKQG